jgi:crotonobetainyl-CoA:carnitine CoA-transferase CaiB-like acyl-CoA transferase
MHALEGIRLLDFGQYLAGPFGPMIIGDLGADVIKVEPVRGDGMRLAAKPFFGCQRGKRDIALDLKDPTGLEIAHRLIRIGTATVCCISASTIHPLRSNNANPLMVPMT